MGQAFSPGFAMSRRTVTATGSHIALLQAAILGGAAAKTAFDEWQGSVDLAHLPPGQYPLLPRLYRNLERLRVEHPWLAALKGIYKRNWYANQLTVQTAARLVQALVQMGIPTALADALPFALISNDGGVRPIETLALVVPDSQVPAAWDTLSDEGLHFAVPYRRDTSWLSSRRFYSESGLAIDLYGHVLPFWPSADLESVTWARMRTVDLMGNPVATLSITDQLLRCCRAAYLPSSNSLLVLSDVAVLLSSFIASSADQKDYPLAVTGVVDWEAVLASAETGNVCQVLLSVLRLFAETMGVTIPPAVSARLEINRPSLYERLEGSWKLPAWPAGCPPLTALRLAYAEYRRIAAARNISTTPSSLRAYVHQRWGPT